MTALALSRKSNGRSLSTVPAIEALRQRAGHTMMALCVAAGIGERTYRRLISGECEPQPRTLIKLSRALDHLGSGSSPSPRPVLIFAFWRAAVLFLSTELGADAALALADDNGCSRPMDPAWLKAARARMLAFYLAHVELQVSLTALAEACGTSKQRVHKATRTVEDMRDDPAIDALLTRAAVAVTGNTP
ncbi:helix-turn-helix domain-containing protein [Ancylobacter sp. WKF20]|uniref:helix-turn-helix domain-containing protein n=1 Tax=Ancylobacter sp. WKF20 TaxID=3039801 RepID=UPI00243421B0|nr:helix-turn-helix domain-containing protein [Ancylobacter sp. WKF20]WGD31303.1 helix-turn-helix domain-containing protein [Ancylobacter sp. WKF20]